MTQAGEQSFTGTSHRIRFLFQPSRVPAQTLFVCFADAAEEPQLQYVRELAPLDLARLYLLDDFGPYAGDAGYPGCCYLGERRRLTFADDASALAGHAAATLGILPEQITAVGFGSGGFAALHLALRNGWGRVIAGFPQTRLGRHLTGELDEVARFIAGGTTPSDRRWLDELLFEALADAEVIPSIDVLSGGLNYGRHVLPLATAVERRDAELELTLVGTDAPRAAAAAFAAHLIDRLERGGAPHLSVEIDGELGRHTSPWSKRAGARVMREADGLRCFAPATPKQETGVYAGLRFVAGPLELLRIELTLRRPDELDALIIDACDADEQRIGRWQWRFEQHPPGSGRTALFLSAADGTPAKPTIDGDLSRTATLDVFVRLKEERSADFTVHRIDVFPPADRTPPAPGLELPASAAIAARSHHLRDQASVARHVAALVAEGVFPPRAVLPRRAPRRPRLKVACLLDRFSELGFRYEFDYVDFTPEDFREAIDREQPDLLLVESIWRGKDETWNKLMVPDITGSGPREPVIELVRHCQARGIPTVFWNKEDPPNFEHFAATAVLFDYIFTTDESCVPRYQAIAGHDRVGVLPFAAQPAIHNAIGAPVERPLDVAFLGTFYGRKHAARKRQMEMVLDPAREFGVHIYSRVEAAGGYAFPEKYVPHLIGTIPYEAVLEAYRTYKVLLNVNSVPDSKTMCARRVFEILACGGTVLSGPSPAIEAVLGPGVVHESAGHGQTREILTHVLGNSLLRERTALEGVRRVLRSHTYSDRVAQILRTVGLRTDVDGDTVAMVAVARDDEQARAAIESAAAQVRRPDELVLIAPPGRLDRALHASATVQAAITPRFVDGDPDAPGGSHLAAALEASDSDLIGILALGPLYGPNYLEDLVNAHHQSGADIVGKSSHYRLDGPSGWLTVELREDEHRFVDAVHRDTILARRGAAQRVPPLANEGLDAWQRRCASRGLRIYAADRFNFAVQEHDGADGRSTGRAAFVETFGTGADHALA